MSIAPIRTLKNRGGNVVYYDGTTILGRANVPAGDDVLHPRITMPTKSGKTFVGWATSNSIADWVSTLVSTGEAMSLYAMYVDNTANVVNDANYVTGGKSTSVVRDTSGWESNSATFNLNKRRYATASASISSSASGNATAKFNNGILIQRSTGWGTTYSTVTPSSGNNTLTVELYYDESESGTKGVWESLSSLTLSNPIAWT